MFISRGLLWLRNKVLYGASKFLLKILASGPIPKHVAFILDGNRRYARKNNKPIFQGHIDGGLALARILVICLRLNVKCISVYVFSIENYKRPEEEVSTLMALAKEKLIEVTRHGNLLDKYGIRLNIVGNKRLLPEAVQQAAREAEDMTRHNKRAILNVHMSYTSCDEITSAVTSCIRNSIHECSKDPIITEKDIDAQLMTSLSGSPPLDILIRPSGVKRLSDYMLWQCCEDTQIHFCPTYWPDFGLFDFIPIILDYQRKVWNTRRNASV